MSRSYYEESRRDFINRIEYLKDGNLSGVVKTNVSSLLKYFSHPVFERVVASTKSSGGKKSK